MSVNPSYDPQNPDPQQKIQDLEGRVEELSALVRTLVDNQAPLPEPVKATENLPVVVRQPAINVVDGMRESVQRALGGEDGESLESRIGGIWLSRVAAVIALTAIALGGAVTLSDDSVQPLHKVITGYSLGVAALAYGLFSRRREDVFAQTMLGSGLAVIYFVTYAALFLDTMRVFPDAVPPLPVLVGCLTAIGLICHFKRSQTAAGIALFLLYYTIVLSLSENVSDESIQYSFLTLAMASVLALIFHLTHRWLFFTWAALIGTHATYLYFFYAKPAELAMGPADYFWFSNGLLTLSYIVFSLACITDARKTGEYRQTVAPMAGVNSFVFLVVTWFSIRETYPELEWAFRLGITGLLLLFAAYAAMTGPRRNYLFQIFAAKAVIIFTLSLQAYLSHEWLLIALSVECFGLALSYMRSGTVLFKVMELGLLGIAFAGCMFAVRIDGVVVIGEYAIQANWFCCVGTAIMFGFTATLYEHFIRPTPAHEREARSQWFLADTFLDVSSHTVALIHAAAAALVLLVLTIIDLGSDPMLPFVLAGEALLVATVGFFLRTAQIEVASVLLLVASHVCYHLFIALNMAGFEEQPAFGLYICMLAGFTFFGGYLWERYLQRIKDGRNWEHGALAALPYVAAYLLLSSFMTRQLDGIFVPLLENGIAVSLLLVGAAAVLQGLRAASILALALSSVQFMRALFEPGSELTARPEFIWVLGGMIATYYLAERLVRLWAPQQTKDWTGIDTLRAGIVSTMVAVGVAGLWLWAPADRLTYCLVAFAVIAMTLGVLSRTSAHRWAALAIYFVAIGRAYAYDLTELTQLYRFASFMTLCIPLVVVSWVYSQLRLRRFRTLKAPADGEQSV